MSTPFLSAAVLTCFLLPCATPSAGQSKSPEIPLHEAFKRLNRSTQWVQLSATTVGFDTYHPQGFAIADTFLFLSSVEVIEQTKRYEHKQGGMDRSEGRGLGHLFKMDLEGNLVDQIKLSEGAIYHPGGIDFGGGYIWVPVAEYRPDSRSIIYRVDPYTMKTDKVFEYPDHIGGIVFNSSDHSLTGVSWGSRRYYVWPLNDALEAENLDTPPQELQTPNPSHYIDYQDCQYIPSGYAICSGLADFYHSPTNSRFVLGGLDLIDLLSSHAVHQIPLSLWTEHGIPLTQNPIALDIRKNSIRMYAMPEDNKSRLFILETGISDRSENP